LKIEETELHPSWSGEGRLVGENRQPASLKITRTLFISYPAPPSARANILGCDFSHFSIALNFKGIPHKKLEENDSLSDGHATILSPSNRFVSLDCSPCSSVSVFMQLLFVFVF
jgi:hypothetical protein